MGSSKPVLQIALNLALTLGLMLSAIGLPDSRASAETFDRQESRSFMTEIRRMVTLNYLLYLPKEYGDDKSKQWPLILFLHGAGERGSDLNKVKSLGPPKLVAEGKEMPFIIVSPQVPERSTWDPEALDALLGEIIGQYAVDEARIYLTGVSMGGAGTWRGQRKKSSQ
jgi:predicted peptidase